METNIKPDFVHHVKGSYDTLTEQASKGVVDLNLGTVWNAWNDSWSGSKQDTNRRVNPSTTSGNIKTTTTTISTEQRVGQTRSGIRTSLVPKEVRKSLGDRVIGLSLVPYIRAADVSFVSKGMKPNTRVYAFFDGVDVNDEVTPTGSSAGAALTTDANGQVSGVFAIPKVTPKPIAIRMVMTEKEKFEYQYAGQKIWRSGRRTFRLTSNAANSLTGDIFTVAEQDYVAKGMSKTVQDTIVSTREANYSQNTVAEDTIITRTGTRTESETQVVEQKIHHDPASGNAGTSNDSSIPNKAGTYFASPYNEDSYTENEFGVKEFKDPYTCLLYTSPSPRDS